MAVMHVRQTLVMSERRTCRVTGQHRSTQRKRPQGKVDEELLTTDIIKLAREYGRYGYRRIAVMLENAGWQVNVKRVERIWRREGLKVPIKQPKRGRLWFNDGSCVRLRALRPNHVWSYDFVHDRTYDGKAFRTLNILDEYTRECLSIRVDRKLNSENVIDVLTDLFIIRGFPEYIRSDNGPEFVSEVSKKLDLSSWSEKLLISNLAVLGKMDFAKALMDDLETNSSMERYSIHLRKRRFS